MALLLQELLRPTETITINEVVIELTPFTLQAEINCEGFLKRASTGQDAKFDDLLFVLWELTKNKAQFNYNKNELKKLILSAPRNDLMNIGKDIYNKFYELFKDSRPVVKNRQKYEELLKIQQEQGAVVCYGVYFDKLSSRYSMTLEDFSKLTLRQMHALLMVASDQKYDDLAVTASLAGKKLKPKMNFDHDIDEETDKKLDDEALNMFQNLKKKFEDKNK